MSLARSRGIARRYRQQQSVPDLDITAFMNLMIILVPVLLMSMVFSHTTVLDLQLPDLLSGDKMSSPVAEPMQLEVLVYRDHMQVNYPSGVLVKAIPKQAGAADYPLLITVLKQIKQRLAGQGIEKRDVQLLLAAGVDYQVLVTTMDAVTSYTAVVGVDVVQAELFPDIVLGDAPASLTDIAAATP
ncbi:MAG: biopolymer transport protein ExbD [Candidatus Pseudothioglobus sp.]|jgi:biopolymer transport protein ExbD